MRRPARRGQRGTASGVDLDGDSLAAAAAAGILATGRGWDASGGPLLEPVASGRFALATTGASDWLNASGTAEHVEGGYRVTTREAFQAPRRGRSRIAWTWPASLAK